MCSAAWEKRKVEDKKFAYNRKQRKKTSPHSNIATVVAEEDDEGDEVEGAVVEEGGDVDASTTPASAASASSADAEEEEEEEEEEDQETLTPEQVALVGECTFARCEATCRQGLELDGSSIPLRERLQALRDAGHATDEAADQAMRDPEAGTSSYNVWLLFFSSLSFFQSFNRSIFSYLPSPLPVFLCRCRTI